MWSLELELHVPANGTPDAVCASDGTGFAKCAELFGGDQDFRRAI